MAHILVVEDNPDYRELLQNFLESDGHSVAAAGDGIAALHLVRQNAYSLVMLDLMLPGMDGYEVCKAIRKDSDVPVIMLTALDSEAHQLRAFDLRIDDYITKSISMHVLLRKVDAVLRRSSPPEAGLLNYRDLTLDVTGHTVCVDGKPVDFTLREYKILLELMQASGRVVTREMLLSKLWNYDFYGDARIVDTHIKNIRRKLGDENYIETIRGVGYKMQKAD